MGRGFAVGEFEPTFGEGFGVLGGEPIAAELEACDIDRAGFDRVPSFCGDDGAELGVDLVDGVWARLDLVIGLGWGFGREFGGIWRRGFECEFGGGGSGLWMVAVLLGVPF